MSYDLILKAITVLIGAISAFKIVWEVSIGRRSRMREEYKFAKEFLDEIKSNKAIHPFLREKGFQAIAGDSGIGAEEVAYLLSLEKPARALRDYVLARAYLEHLGAGGQEIAFKRKYRNRTGRKFRIYVYGTLYVLLAFVAFSPLVFSKVLFNTSGQMLAAFLITLAAAAPNAWSALDAAVRLDRAEKLVSNQRRHTPMIVVDRNVA